ncbi:hypothetical protein NMK62_09605 [Escherichia coli]|nr:hypothetical protein [Escherichia coli]UTQ05912.1 hypothetical protein NMK62_09605 [Escherichia coli]
MHFRADVRRTQPVFCDPDMHPSDFSLLAPGVRKRRRRCRMRKKC